MENVFTEERYEAIKDTYIDETYRSCLAGYLEEHNYVWDYIVNKIICLLADDLNLLDWQKTIHEIDYSSWVATSLNTLPIIVNKNNIRYDLKLHDDGDYVSNTEKFGIATYIKKHPECIQGDDIKFDTVLNHTWIQKFFHTIPQNNKKLHDALNDLFSTEYEDITMLDGVEYDLDTFKKAKENYELYKDHLMLKKVTESRGWNGKIFLQLIHDPENVEIEKEKYELDGPKRFRELIRKLNEEQKN
uniref:Uncharacterized protein n=1 Tax=viral metagenome TaxID=1070528 RepID=A0A6C0ED81_9ZZZZ